MDIERAIEILDPEHRERYDSIETVDEACRMGREALRQQLAAQGGDFVSRETVKKALEDECAYLRERGMLNAEHVLLHHGVAVIDKLPVADAKSLEKIGEEVDEALRILDNAHGRMDYGDYCDLHDAITGIAVPDSGAEAKEVQNDA